METKKINNCVLPCRCGNPNLILAVDRGDYFAFELVAGGASRDESQVFIDPEEALSALEEQAPEILREWVEKNYIGMVDAFIEKKVDLGGSDD